MSLFAKAAKAFNIHLFDGTNYNVQTTLLNSEGNDLSPEMKTFYAKFLIELVEPKLVHDQFAQKVNIPKNGGKVIEFRKYDSLAKALTPIEEGKTPDGNKLNVTTITSEVHQYGDYIVLSDILTLTAIDNNIVQATKLLGNQAGRTLDTVTRDVLATNTSVLLPEDSNGDEILGRHLLTPTDVVTPDLIFQSAAILGGNNAATIGDSYVAVIHPYAAYDLMRSDEWIDIKTYDSDDYYKGEIGRIGNVRFVESTEAKIFKGADLASDTRTLAVNGAVTAGDSYITFDGSTAGVEADALIGRQIIIDSKIYNVTDNDTTKIYVKETLPAIADNKVIYPGEGGADGIAVFAVTVIAENAYGTTEIEGGGLEHIYKPLGSGGTEDALNQRASCGWKATKTAEILVPQYMVRIECGSKYSNKAEAN